LFEECVEGTKTVPHSTSGLPPFFISPSSAAQSECAGEAFGTSISRSAWFEEPSFFLSSCENQDPGP
jgi:hypothetical protein